MSGNGQPAWCGGVADGFAWRGHQIACETVGDGPPVLLIHHPDLGASRAEWRALAPRLAAAGYRAIALDLLGFGQSDCPPIWYEADLYLELLTDFRDAMIGEPCHLAGRGMGAAYAAVLATAAPALHPSLTAINPFGIRPAEPQAEQYRQLAGSPAARAAYNAVTEAGELLRWLREEVYYAAEQVSAEVLAQVAQVAQRDNAEFPIAGQVAGLLYRDIRREWVALEQPILLVWGEACEVPSLQDVDDYLMPLRPNAPFFVMDQRPVGIWKQSVTYKCFPYTRQLPHVEASEGVASALLEHLGAAELDARLNGSS
ncbi:MAG: alpha/beta hydrolase [Armatimonadetes bacterium]|nr:alpha/beta hydrolase [Armatimonadota bacterium]